MSVFSFIKIVGTLYMLLSILLTICVAIILPDGLTLVSPIWITLLVSIAGAAFLVYSKRENSLRLQVINNEIRLHNSSNIIDYGNYLL